MSEKRTVDQIASRVHMTIPEIIAVAKRAGIRFDPGENEINDADYKRLLEYLSKKSIVKTKKTLSIGPGGSRPKLGIAPVVGDTASGPNVVRKRTIVQTRNTEEINRQVLRRQSEASVHREKEEKKQTKEKQALAASRREASEKKQKTAKASSDVPPQTTDSSSARGMAIPGMPNPFSRGPVPKIQIVNKTASKGSGKGVQTKPAQTNKTGLTKTQQPKGGLHKAAGTVQGIKKPLHTAVKAPDNKKTRRSRSSSVTPKQKGRENEDLQLNEFQRRKGEGRSQELMGPLQSTFLNQSFSLPASLPQNALEIGEQVQVGEFAHQMGIKAGKLIKELMKLKVMATVNQSIDFDTAEVAADHFGFTLVRKSQIDLEHLVVGGDKQSHHPEHIRPPVITVMGHVDHGKTSLLDYIRRTKVVEGESGGITQHIGAYHVRSDKGGITFLDTPGHAAFTAMRARGAQVTDIVILVVAADDKVMPQTVEAIQHARSAKVPIVVALNKIDRPEADPDRIINELSAHELVPESWGGDTQFIKVSAHSGEGIDELLDAVLLQAEMLELKAQTAGQTHGVVVESWLDKTRGPLATVLVDQGVMSNGVYVLAGTAFGRVRAMFDERGDKVTSAGPSMPVKILGLSEVPEAGDELLEVTNERAARELIDQRQQDRKRKSQPSRPTTNLFSDEEAAKVLPLVIKADTQGTIGAILHALAELENDKLELKIVLSGVGGISESDVVIAHATGARVVGFNVRADKKAVSYCEKEGVNLKYYSIIYELIEEIDNTLHGLLDMIIEEKILGIAEVRDVFSVSKFGKIAGCMVTEGTIHRSKPIRVLRDNLVIYQGELESLRRFKDDAREVRSGMECGIGVKNYKDVKAGDKIEVFDRIEKRPPSLRNRA